jgi:Na+-transporting NADH:ubiquinone oxidoreductase subunit A
MSKSVKIRKGLNIKLKGEADKVLVNAEVPSTVAIKPPDFHGLVPKMVLKEGAEVKAGTTIFYDKYNDKIKFVSPVSGEIAEIVRGAKRRIMEVKIVADKETKYEAFSAGDPNAMSREQVIEHLLNAGLWPSVVMRPLAVIANPEDKPKAIFVSGFDSSPLAIDYDFVVHGKDSTLQVGFDALKKLTEGKVNLTLRSGQSHDKALTNLKGVDINSIGGPHPAGNVGIQIHHIDRLAKGEIIWTLNLQDVMTIGRYFESGKYDATRVIALTGSEVKKPQYYRTIIGASIEKLVENNVEGDNNRFISGNVLTGDHISPNGYLGYYHHQVTVIPEGDEPQFFLTKGWLSPGFHKLSASRAYPSWLMPNKKYRLDTNANGEDRAFVMTGQYEKVLPMDIYPVHLLKSIITNDIEGMENLGIYEIAPEDLALCEFVCTSKTDVQQIVREGLTVVKEECM